MELSIIQLHGSPGQMGRDFGEACRQQVRELYERRMAAAIKFARSFGERDFQPAQVLEVARRCLPITRAYDAEGHEEFLGIAEGAGLSAEALFVTQGLTDLRDVLVHGAGAAPANGMELARAGSDAAPGQPEPPDALEGCSAFYVGNDRAQDGQMLIGQNWDLQTDNMPYIRLVHRQPDTGPRTWSLTLTGCLTLIGINEEGIAVGNTNLRTRDARIGLQYLSVLHRAIRCRTLEQAVSAIADAPRSAAHYYYLGGPDGHAVGLECSATRCHHFHMDQGEFVHCNHCLAEPIRDLQTSIAFDSTTWRQQRLETLLRGHAGPVGPDDLRAMLSDHEGGNDGICRHDIPPFGVSTNASVIMCPARREIQACRGQPHVGQWVTRGF